MITERDHIATGARHAALRDYAQDCREEARLAPPGERTQLLREALGAEAAALALREERAS